PEELKKLNPIAVAGKTKIVDPSITKTSEGQYPSLAQAQGETQPGDEILIKNNGAEPLPIDPLRLVKAADGTSKPQPGCRPVLIVKRDARDKHSFFLRIYDGCKLKLKQLEFRIQPTRDEYLSQTVAEVVGDGQVIFEDCVITQEETVKTP